MNYKKIIIKVGSSFIFENGIDKIVKNISDIKKDKQVILVSSGAVSEARKFFTKSKIKNKLESKELSAIGQPIIFYQYFEKFLKHQIISAQVLISKRPNFSLIKKLLKNNILPIINGNDADNKNDLMFFDNDSLAGEVALEMDNDLLVIITDIDAVYSDNPKKNKNAEKFSILDSISEELLKNSKDTGSDFGTGGMYTKLLIARKMLRKNIDVYITDDLKDLKNLLDNKNYKGTLITSKNKK